MTSKEALSDLSFLSIGDENHTIKCKETIEKDLDRLEKLEKAIEILKKAFGLHYILEYDNNICSMTNEEYKLLKEVIQNDK